MNAVWRAVRVVAHEARLLAVAALDAIPYEDMEQALDIAAAHGAREATAVLRASSAGDGLPLQCPQTFGTGGVTHRSTITG